MGLPITLTKALTAGAATAVCASQTPLAAGNLTINGTLASGGVATLTTQRRILFTFAGNESARTFVVYGTNQSGAAISETVAGTTIGTTATNLDFKTVTRISIDAASAGAMTVGTNTVGSTDWQSVNTFITPPNIGIQLTLSGTANFSIETTQFDANNLPSSVSYPTPVTDPNFNGLSASYTGTINDTISMFRLTMNSGTGTVTMTYNQSGLAQ